MNGIFGEPETGRKRLAGTSPQKSSPVHSTAHYVPAARAFEGALALSASVQPDKTDDLKDDLNYARAFAVVPPMTMALKSAESTPLTRDSMNLSRASATINGHRVDAGLRMSLDTGANRSSLAPSAISAFPALANGATQGRTSQAGAGGVSPNEAGTLIPQVTLQIGDQATALTRVPVSPGPNNCEGTLGQDVLRSGGGYVIDFDGMTLEILSSPAAPHSADAR